MPTQEYYIHPKTKENHCGRCGLVVAHYGDPHNDTLGRVCEPGRPETVAEIEPVITAPIAEIDDFDSGGEPE